MMPVFTFPFAFIALLAVPALVAIYWLRNRARQRRVSSLLLWRDEKQRWEGGQRIYRLQTPLLFFLELLTILLLALAAAGPVMRAGERARPLVVVLDDSFSMLAGNERSARSQAVLAIENELRTNRYDSVRFVLAGESPQVLGETTSRADQALELLQNWRCGAAQSNLEEAVAFAFEIGGARARVLAVTDHAPGEELADSRLQWWAFGSSRQNFAFVNATRTGRDTEDRVLLEIANLSVQSGSTMLTIESQPPQSLSLGPGETKRILMTLKPGAPALRARLSDDALDLDNEVVLLPEPARQVRTDLRVGDAPLRTLFERALQSLPNVMRTADNPEIVITDTAESSTENTSAWTLWIIRESDAASFLGPFVVDRAHPLAEGLSLGGVVWGSGRSRELPGTPVITAGNIPLLSDLDRAGRHELRLRLRPDLSTLHETPNFPILLANLLDWRGQAAPGLREANIRLGGEATLAVEPGGEAVTVVDPERDPRQVRPQENRVTIQADRKGIYEISASGMKYNFAANALQRDESDLTRAASGRWGNWANAAAFQWEYRSVAWVLLLLALIVLAVHTWLVWRNTVKQ
ncbi:MAG: vWA domain-containing protein [Blastocatellia bacterium]